MGHRWYVDAVTEAVRCTESGLTITDGWVLHTATLGMALDANRNALDVVRISGRARDAERRDYGIMRTCADVWRSPEDRRACFELCAGITD